MPPVCDSCRASVPWYKRSHKCATCNATVCGSCASKSALCGAGMCKNCLNDDDRGLTTALNSPMPSDVDAKSTKHGPGVEGGDVENMKITTEEIKIWLQAQDSTMSEHYAVLQVRIVEARGLIATDLDLIGRASASDPYCVVSLERDGTSHRTKTVKSSLEPSWNSEYVFYVHYPGQRLKVEIFDRDMTSRDDILGFVYLNLSHAASGRQYSGWLKLEHPDELDKPAGAVFIEMRLDYTAKAELRAFVKCALEDKPPTPPPGFDVNQLYGPGMYMADVLWFGLLAPVVFGFISLLLWEHPIRSAFGVFVWIVIATYIEWMPAFAIAVFIVFHIKNGIAKKYNDFTKVYEGDESAAKKSSFLSVPLPVPVPNPLKALPSIPFVDKKKDKKGEEKEDPTSEQNLGSLTSRAAMVAPAWVKEICARLQPVLRIAADLLVTAQEVLAWHKERLAMYLLYGLLGAFVVVVVVPFKYIVMAMGMGLLLAMSPVSRLGLGLVHYAQRPKRGHEESIQKIGFNGGEEIHDDWLSDDYLKHFSKKGRPEAAHLLKQRTTKSENMGLPK